MAVIAVLRLAPGPNLSNIDPVAVVASIADRTGPGTIALSGSGSTVGAAYSWSVFAPGSSSDVASTYLSSTTALSPTLTLPQTGALAGVWTVVLTVTSGAIVARATRSFNWYAQAQPAPIYGPESTLAAVPAPTTTTTPTWA